LIARRLEDDQVYFSRRAKKELYKWLLLLCRWYIVNTQIFETQVVDYQCFPFQSHIKEEKSKRSSHVSYFPYSSPIPSFRLDIKLLNAFKEIPRLNSNSFFSRDVIRIVRIMNATGLIVVNFKIYWCCNNVDQSWE